MRAKQKCWKNSARGTGRMATDTRAHSTLAGGVRVTTAPRSRALPKKGLLIAGRVWLGAVCAGASSTGFSLPDLPRSPPWRPTVAVSNSLSGEAGLPLIADCPLCGGMAFEDSADGSQWWVICDDVTG